MLTTLLRAVVRMSMDTICPKQLGLSKIRPICSLLVLFFFRLTLCCKAPVGPAFAMLAFFSVLIISWLTNAFLEFSIAIPGHSATLQPSLFLIKKTMQTALLEQFVTRQLFSNQADTILGEASGACDRAEGTCSIQATPRPHPRRTSAA